MIETLTLPERTDAAARDRSTVELRRARAIRLWNLPLWVHGGLLLVVLVVAAAWIGTNSSFTSDEGASVLQARAIEHGHWVLADPLAKIDPQGRHYPIELSATGRKGSAPLGKHLFYGVVLAAVGRVFGVDGMVALSLLGTVAAALLAAALSRELRPGIERAVIWFVGLGTPLFFDGFLLVAQAVAAAVVTGAVLLVLRYMRTGSRGLAGGACLLCGLSCLLRTEALLWCVGLAVGVLSLPSGIRPRRMRGMLAAGLIVASAVVARAADSLLTSHAVGASQAVVGAVPGGHGLGDQLHATFVSWFQAEPDPLSVLGAWTVVALAVMAVTARMVLRGRFSSVAVLSVGGAALLVWGLRLHSGPSTPISGLAVAAPVLWVGLWLVDRRLLRQPAARLCAVASLGFSGLVLATEYPDGGGLQWGGRFFAIAVPVMAPLGLEAIRRQAPRLAPSIRAAMAGCLLVLTGVIGAGAVQTLHSGHVTSSAMARALDAVISSASPGDGGPPVVLTSQSVLPRLEWPLFYRLRWQLVPPQDMAVVARSLRRSGISTFVLVTTDPRLEASLFSSTSFSGGPVRTVSGVSGWYLITFHGV